MRSSRTLLRRIRGLWGRVRLICIFKYVIPSEKHALEGKIGSPWVNHVPEGVSDIRVYLVFVRTSPRASTKYGRSSLKKFARRTMFSLDREEDRVPPRSSDSRWRRNEERFVVLC